VPESDDFVLVGADYSQIELRVLAHLSGDESLIKDFNDGADIHRRTAARVFNVQEDQVTDLQRSRAKAVNFGVLYGQSGFGLSEGLGITMKDAKNYINDYYDKHQAVREYLDQAVAEGKSKGYVTTIMGRRRDIPEINASNFMVRSAGERLAMNTPIQGSAADIMKLAMINVYNRLKKEGATSRVILQVHDELIIETLKSELDEIKTLLKEEMENAYQLRVPLVAEVNTGSNWFDLK
jgi:DNA polymerase-1